MSELSKKRVRTSLIAIAQFKRACILSSSLSERFDRIKFLGAAHSKNTYDLGNLEAKKLAKNFIKASAA
jgi:hypothetical protein